MKIVKQSALVCFHLPLDPELNANPEFGGDVGMFAQVRFLEHVARTCYKSQPRGKPDEFVGGLARMHHDAMLEHCVATAFFVTDRGVSHELVRHRLASFAQESTRWCNYGKEKFGREITVIEPPGLEGVNREYWANSVGMAEIKYLSMVGNGVSPQIARSVLPNCLKTEIVVTANLREWMHIFELRLSKSAHPQMRELMGLALPEFVRVVPVLFKQFEDPE
jgi:thymidylate synthase (FAD)